MAELLDRQTSENIGKNMTVTYECRQAFAA